MRRFADALVSQDGAIRVQEESFVVTGMLSPLHSVCRHVEEA